MKRRVLQVVYYSRTGHTERLARSISSTLSEDPFVNAQVFRVESFEPKMFLEADGVALGSPTHAANVAWQVKRLIDDCRDILPALEGKVAGGFTSTGTRRDGERCLQAIDWAFELAHLRRVEGLVVTENEPSQNVERSCKDFARRLLEALPRRG